MAESVINVRSTNNTIYDYKMWQVIAASSAGTMIEWYDFYLYGTLAVFFSTLFYPQGNPTAGFLASLATFGAGFAVRPFGAVFFGRVSSSTPSLYLAWALASSTSCAREKLRDTFPK